MGPARPFEFGFVAVLSRVSLAARGFSAATIAGRSHGRPVHLAGAEHEQRRRGGADSIPAPPNHFRVRLFLADERIQVLQRDGTPLLPALFLDPAVIRVLIREDLLRAPRGQQEWTSVRIKSGVATSTIYACMRRGNNERDRLPTADDSQTVRRTGIAGPEHRWRTGSGDHPYDPRNGAGSGWDVPPAE